MSDTASSTDRKPPSAFRLFLYGLIAVVAFGLVALVTRWQIDKAKTKNELAALEARLDEEDPNWRLADLDKSREVVDDKENSALVVVEVAKALDALSKARGLRESWPEQKFSDQFRDQQPNELLDPERAALLDLEMRTMPFLPRARQLAEMRRGKHKLVWAEFAFNTLLNDQQECRKVAALLNYDAMDLAQKGKIDDALRSARACINTARSLGDEPLLISQLIRIAGIAIAGNAIERSLALGQASDAELVRVQELLALEAQHNTLLLALRGERAASFDTTVKMAEGKLPADTVTGALGGPAEPPWYERLFMRGVSRREPIYNLRIMTKAVEAAKLPEHEQAAAASVVEGEADALPRDATLTKLLQSAVSRMGDVFRRKSALVRALLVLVAVERYRLKHGKWPDSLEQLKPDLLKEIPLDPHDGKPIRYKKLSEGVVVYSVGKDGIDDGGTIVRNRGIEAGTDLGFWLWDVNARRQPGKPKPKEQP